MQRFTSCTCIRYTNEWRTTQRAFAMPSATIITIISIARFLFRQAVSPRRRNKKKYRGNSWRGTESKISRDLRAIERSWRHNGNRKRFLIFFRLFSVRVTFARVSTLAYRRKLISACPQLNR